jgi:hypothetical protein
MGLEPRRSAESRMTICGLQTTLTFVRIGLRLSHSLCDKLSGLSELAAGPPDEHVPGWSHGNCKMEAAIVPQPCDGVPWDRL